MVNLIKKMKSFYEYYCIINKLWKQILLKWSDTLKTAPKACEMYCNLCNMKSIVAWEICIGFFPGCRLFFLLQVDSFSRRNESCANHLDIVIDNSAQHSIRDTK